MDCGLLILMFLHLFLWRHPFHLWNIVSFLNKLFFYRVNFETGITYGNTATCAQVGGRGWSWGLLSTLSTRLPWRDLQGDPGALFFRKRRWDRAVSPHTSPSVSWGPHPYRSFCLECSHSRSSPHWTFIFIQLKNNSPGGHIWPPYLRWSPSVTHSAFPSWCWPLRSCLWLLACVFH